MISEREHRDKLTTSITVINTTIGCKLLFPIVRCKLPFRQCRDKRPVGLTCYEKVPSRCCTEDRFFFNIINTEF